MNEIKNKVFSYINEYESIIIARHKNPDLDAYGSQFGLYYALKDYFKNKKIYVIGDTNSLNQFGEFDEVNIDIAKKSLLLILDTVSKQMLDENVYKYYDKLIFIDHHQNNPDIKNDLAYQIKNASSAAEIIADLLMYWNIPINYDSARALYLGIIGDTGRFKYSNTTEKTLLIASKLLSKGLNIQEIHNSIYLESRRNKEIKNIFFQRIKYSKNNVAYSKNDIDFILENNLTTNYVSRGLVNQMSGMREVPIWVNFTEDTENHKIYCEIRSRDIAVINVAIKFGGGGHLHACGCTLNNWNEVDLVISDLDNLLEEKK
ncbi:MAG: hypothetical protein B6I17_01870 [Tenericutes bacterium 4572_104]|nr:MAG: hypothetical protein B6I17_01870 [Tenericutes bacterium 4572_104]